MTALLPLEALRGPPLPAGAERLRRRTRRALRLIALLVFGFFGLAAALPIGGAVIGAGEVMVESSVKTITHPTGGILTRLLVRDGDHVVQGQPLMRFDTSVSRVGSDSAATGLEQLLARRARLQAERDGAATIAWPPELAGAAARALVAREQRLFDLRGVQRRGSLALLVERIRQYDEQIASYRAQIEAIESQEVLIAPELAGLRKLYERQLVTLARINELERTAVQLKGSRAALGSSIAEARARISETREQMLNVDKSIRSDAAGELAEVVAQLNDQQVRRASAEDTYARSLIRAPQSGTIDKLAFTTIGSAVPAAQPILQIVPDRDTLLVEARVRPADVDQLHAGQAARISFSGLDRQTTPDIPGTLVFVSPDLTQDPHSGQSFYRIRVRLDPKRMATAKIVLKAGMPAEAFVQTGTRSMLSFLTKPLIDQIRYAFREG